MGVYFGLLVFPSPDTDTQVLRDLELEPAPFIGIGYTGSEKLPAEILPLDTRQGWLSLLVKSSMRHHTWDVVAPLGATVIEFNDSDYGRRVYYLTEGGAIYENLVLELPAGDADFDYEWLWNWREDEEEA